MKSFDELVAIMAKLRSPNGCPWDKEQSYKTLKPYIIEEAYEVIDSIDNEDMNNLKEELGDFVLQAVFLSQLANEDQHFDINDVLKGINEKLIRRHPHVFGDTDAKTSDDVLRNWDKIKAEEKGKVSVSILDDVPKAFPSLIRAYKLQKKAANVGFDWPNSEGIFQKIDEEINEVKEALEQQDSPSHLENEIGDLLFCVVNLARKNKIDPELALEKANQKFKKRFQYVESTLKTMGKDIHKSNLKEMDQLWEQSKANEKV